MNDIAWIAAGVACGVLLLPLFSKMLSGADRLHRTLRILVLIAYVLIILYVTLLSRSMACSFKYAFSPLWSYRRALALWDEGGRFGLFVTDGLLLRQIILNILLYIPLGYLLPFSLPRLAARRHAVAGHRVRNAVKAFPWKAVLFGTTLSMFTECTQLVFRLGFFELDDILNNTIGCLIGLILYQLLLRPRAIKAE